MMIDKAKLLDEAEQLLTDIALSKSGYTSEHAQRIGDIVSKMKQAKDTSQRMAA